MICLSTLTTRVKLKTGEKSALKWANKIDKLYLSHSCRNFPLNSFSLMTKFFPLSVNYSL